MDRNDIRVALDMLYEELGWDRATGAPTRKTYRKFGLDDVAHALAERKLVPA
jgi:aldehyde:ferredoxin oxidoreductase